MNAAAGTWDGEALVKSKHAETLHQVIIMATTAIATKMSTTLCFKGSESSFHPTKWVEVSDGRLHS